jgi:hypothetical protein
MTSIDLEKFASFAEPLIGLEVSHVWMGYGSAIFIEFGELHARVRRNGHIGINPRGEMTLFVTWGWRVEGKRRVWCGSWSEKERWPRVFKRMLGPTVTSISLTGRLGEVDLGLSNGLHFVTCVTLEGDPDWSLTNREGVHMEIIAGRIRFDLRDETRVGSLLP